MDLKLLITLALYCQGCIAGTVLNFTAKNDQVVQVPYSMAVNLDMQWTFCVRFHLRIMTTQTIFFDPSWRIGLMPVAFVDQGFIFVKGQPIIFSLKERFIQPFTWYHLCASYSTTMVHVVLQGKVVLSDNEATLAKSSGKALNTRSNSRIWTIGPMISEKDFGGGPIDGMVTELNVWSKVLKVDQMIQITEHCGLVNSLDIPSPDGLKWSNLNLDSGTLNNGPQVVQMPLDKACFTTTNHQVQVVPMPLPFNVALHHCGQFGAEMYIPETKEALDKLAKQIRATFINELRCGQDYWLPLQKDVQNDWTAVNKHGTVPSFMPWGGTEPNGRQLERCAVINLSKFSPQHVDQWSYKRPHSFFQDPIQPHTQMLDVMWSFALPASGPSWRHFKSEELPTSLPLKSVFC